MADVKITSLTVLTAADPINDAIPIVDVSNTIMAASGTTSRISINNILGASGTATLASATITGAATVGTTLGVTGASTLTGNVGVGVAQSAWKANFKAIQIGAFSTAYGAVFGDDSGNTNFSQQFFQGTSNRIYVANGNAASYRMTQAGEHQFFTDSAGGLAGANVTTFTQATTLDKNGNLLVGVTSANANGGVLQLKSGITFPATQVASSDANTLDDYEEGSWTPVFQGTNANGTYVYSTQVGRYTKVGNLVTVFGHLVISSITTAAIGVMRIGGLPFTTSSANVYAAATVGWTDLITISSGTLALSVNTNGVIIDMYRILSGAGVGFITPSDLVVNTRINFTATYFV